MSRGRGADFVCSLLEACLFPLGSLSPMITSGEV